MPRKGLSELDRLQRRIVACRACPRLVEHRERTGREKRRAYRDHDYWARPVPSFGDPAARLFVVGLAPAAHGANRTGRMFTGDRSGQWLYRALFEHGFADRPESLERSDGLRLQGAYISAALHCAPPGNRPEAEEMARCQPFLEAELDLFLNRKRKTETFILLALGAVAFKACLGALAALGRGPDRPLPRFGHLAETELGGGLRLLASYHPSQQNTQTGRLTREMFACVFRRARQLL